MSIAATAAPGRAVTTEAKFARLWTGTLAVLIAATLVLVWFPVLRIGSLPSINYNEGWNAYRDHMAALRQPLYGAPPGLSITNYPFLSFHIIGLLSGPAGNVVTVGRLVALAALFAICAMLFGIVCRLSGSWRGGLFAGLSFFLWVATYTPERVGMSDPELLGLAITLGGLYVYLEAGGRLPWLLLSGFIFAVGMFTKHDTLALPLAAGLHLLGSRAWRALAAWVAAGAITAALLLAATWRLDGPFFFTHLLAPRVYHPWEGVWEIVNYLLRFDGPITIGSAMLLLTPLLPRRDLLVLLLATTHAIAFLFIMGDGVASNVFFCPLIAVAIVSGTAICCLERSLPRVHWATAVMAITLILSAASAAAFVPGQFFKDRAEQKRLPAIAQAAQLSIAQLHRISGPALCEEIMLCYEAGKPLGYDAYFVNDQIAAGRIRQADILAALRAHRYAVIEIGTSELPAILPLSERLRFNGALIQTLASEYRLLSIDGPYAVFVPRPPGARNGS